jgi:hypothetical protein
MAVAVNAIIGKFWENVRNNPNFPQSFLGRKLQLRKETSNFNLY